MIIIPAIDIKNNNCVRLLKGNLKKSFIFSKNPIIVFNRWINEGSKRLHIVDLDGAISGKPKNLLILKELLNFTNKSIDIQIGGGIRDLETINYYFDIGVKYVVLGTKAIIDLDFLEKISYLYPFKIILSLDFKNLKLAINGWKNYHDIDLFKFLKEVNEYNLESIIYTDVNRDGTLKGLNTKIFLKISQILNKPTIISGGLSMVDDVKKTFFYQNKKLAGIICGTSIYKGNINSNNIIKKTSFFNKIYLS